MRVVKTRRHHPERMIDMTLQDLARGYDEETEGITAIVCAIAAIAVQSISAQGEKPTPRTRHTAVADLARMIGASITAPPVELTPERVVKDDKMMIRVFRR
jgi:hypothetical protein